MPFDETFDHSGGGEGGEPDKHDLASDLGEEVVRAGGLLCTKIKLCPSCFALSAAHTGIFYAWLNSLGHTKDDVKARKAHRKEFLKHLEELVADAILQAEDLERDAQNE